MEFAQPKCKSPAYIAERFTVLVLQVKECCKPRIQTDASHHQFSAVEWLSRSNTVSLKAVLIYQENKRNYLNSCRIRAGKISPGYVYHGWTTIYSRNGQCICYSAPSFKGQKKSELMLIFSVSLSGTQKSLFRCWIPAL